VAGALVARALRDPWPAEQGVSVSPDEDAWVSRIVASAVSMVDAARVEGRPFTRDVHSKAHGCVRARVEVGDLEPRLRHGLFGQPGAYDAWLRFSSGDTRVQSDLVRDARGFALKVMGVPGEKLLPAERDEATQDFVMINSRQFFIRTLPDYEAFTAALARGSRYGWFFDGFSPFPWRWRLRELFLAAGTLKPPPASLLETQFHSLSAYRLGPSQFVKYSARPCHAASSPRRDKGENMLREALKADLSQGEGCFDLLVQLQVPGKNMPVEDATVAWSEKDSPFLKVARVTIPRQAFDTPEQNAFCEDLSFTPWHALPEHEPVGVMNRVRRALYQEISRYRHAKNAAPRAEPRGFCLDLTGATCG
jgi:catalase